MKPELVGEKSLLDLPSSVREADKPNDFSIGLAKFCVRIGEMVVCPGDCEACPRICQENQSVMYTRCGRCGWLAYGRLDALLIAEGVHRRIHEDELRRRAYELYEQRQRGDGHDVEDWLRAEKELHREAAASWRSD